MNIIKDIKLDSISFFIMGVLSIFCIIITYLIIICLVDIWKNNRKTYLAIYQRITAWFAWGIFIAALGLSLYYIPNAFLKGQTWDDLFVSVTAVIPVATFFTFITGVLFSLYLLILFSYQDIKHKPYFALMTLG